jgi:hypothetical protein
LIWNILTSLLFAILILKLNRYLWGLNTSFWP